MKISTYAWFIWLLAALFYSYEFFLRVMPTVMQPELMHTYLLTAVQFSTLSASYYYAYALMQIPVGLLIDRFQLKYILSLACALVAFGALLLSSSHTLLLANLSRIAMGVGSAFAFTGCIKIANLEFPQRCVGLIIGLTNTIGVVGAIMADTLFAFLLEHFNWHLLLTLSGLFGLALAILIFMASHQNRLSKHHDIELDANFKTILFNKKIILAALYGAFLVAPISGFAELWSVPFMMAAHGLTKPQAASLNSLIFIGIAIGGTLNGYVSTHVKNRKHIIFAGNLVALISLSLIIYAPIQSKLLLSALLVLFGYSTSNMLLVFAFNSQRSPVKLTGFSIALTNMIIMLVASLAQPLLGAGLTYLQTHSTLPSIEEYKIVFSALLAIQFLGLCVATQFDDPNQGAN